jgi:hypothetical protein
VSSLLQAACCCEGCCCPTAPSSVSVSYTILGTDVQQLFYLAPGSPAVDCDGNPTEPSFSDISGSLVLDRCECRDPGPNIQRPYVSNWVLAYTSRTVQYCGEYCTPGECCCVEGVFRVYLAASLLHQCTTKSWMLTLHANARFTFSGGSCDCYGDPESSLTAAIDELNATWDLIPSTDCEDESLPEYAGSAQALGDTIAPEYTETIGGVSTPADPCDPSGTYGDWGVVS